MPQVIEASHLSKQFKLGAVRHQEDSFRGVLLNGLKASWNALRGRRANGDDTPAEVSMWALRDVSFSINAGDVVGIIGGNGAGKSTLLKILSRITDPTEGHIRLDGRVASLLEVGTGFHPELTGRENIYMNGVMLGMTRAEIQRKFDEIVAFSELERFLDTPVKHYSSGMYVRLGFAVAAHLDPEILVVDEALAVGDMAFQKKCLGKMGEFGESGRTILFVSHNIPAILNLCQKGIVLERGRIVYEGSAKSSVEHYVRRFSPPEPTTETHIVDLIHWPGRAAKFRPGVRKLEVFFGDGTPLHGQIPIGSPLRLRVEFELPHPTAKFDIRVNFLDLYGQVIFAARSTYESQRNWGERTGIQRVICEIPSLPLTPGEHRLDVGLVLEDKQVLDYVEDAFRLHVAETDFYATGQIPSLGFVVQRQRWWLD
jgi:lipopolysaccharide transport system ATP-binding protein